MRNYDIKIPDFSGFTDKKSIKPPTEEEILFQIHEHLDSLPYEGGYPSNYKRTLAKHLSEWINKRLTTNR